MDKTNVAIHLRYFCAILVVLVILIATDRWTNQPEFTTYLSNAATMSSLMLAVVAIFYSFISNDSLSRSLGSINTVSTDVRDATGEITRLVASSTESNNTSIKVASAMERTSQGIESSLETLKRTLENITEQNSELRTALALIPEKIEKLELSVTDATRSMTRPKPDSSTFRAQDSALPSGAIQKFMSRSPLSCNILTHAACLAKNSKKQLDIREFSIAIGMPKSAAYFNGFIVSMHSIGLINLIQIEDLSRTYEIKSVESQLEDRIKPYFNDYISERLEAQEIDEWKQRLLAVEGIFANGNSGGD